MTAVRTNALRLIMDARVKPGRDPGVTSTRLHSAAKAAERAEATADAREVAALMVGSLRLAQPTVAV